MMLRRIERDVKRGFANAGGLRPPEIPPLATRRPNAGPSLSAEAPRKRRS